ncbi:MAG: TetR-like C-terminal domain-containing protein [Bacillota bacterium]|uniref:TetR/AcrR family transcriptional regulator n=1 Tax=Virgibacillus TaxID=84406 RepID=UPI00047A46D8|nr:MULTISPECIES: TetR/AcrR family transcriptional regulator [Bacillaceae]MCC2250434.1 TetR/AcrR family transcriptional regulator [Virgibacillus sp. AGTR]MDY7046537.1 TetR/AcrR family transcriptional regulator [Virgibacillus sp. M23]QRZ19862.1 TetR/AcrR family transcriptional regulator [Virgibacillus sp. AGTR]WBX80457.1 TetR/AcrR family transcriptional regulator [Virgibacillus salarius]
MNPKLDRRKKYTRMVLKDSLISLLSTKQIAAITVKEICEQADINRSTFYTHYKDQFDLLRQIEEEIIADMNTYLSQHNFSEIEKSLQTTERLLEYIVSKSDICNVLLNENGDTSFERRVMEVARSFLITTWMDCQENDAAVSEYISTFIISGSIHVIKHWLANNMDKTPQQIAQIINSIAINGIDQNS